MRILLSICILSLGFSALQANNKEPYEVLNSYVQFVNESIHGLRIVHGLLENFNQDLNQFVDLESTQINAYKNKHLPKNIFEDPEGWFFIDTPSPEKLFEQLKEESSIFGPESSKALLDQAFELRKIYLELNALRFEIENYMVHNPLEEKTHQKSVFKLLERGVTLYESFYQGQNVLYNLLEVQFQSLYPNLNTIEDKVYERINSVHSLSYAFMDALRKKEDKQLRSLIEQINTADHSFTSSSFSFDKKQKMYGKWKSFVTESNVFYTQAHVPADHKLYGKFYYYHNKVLIPCINWQGLGFVRYMNSYMKDSQKSRLHFMEVPVFLQLIYPKKLDPIDHLAASDNNIEILPEKLKDREVIVRNHTMIVDSFILDFKIYDHKLEDGDIISLNFNGDWILEEYTLTTKPKVLKLKINQEGKNYFLLHALNLGKRPPNTMAISYYYKGEKQTIVLSSNLNQSEMIEIIYDPD